MARRYWLKVGGKKYFGTLAEVKQVGQSIANRIGAAVQLGWDQTRPAVRRMTRNPLMGGHDFTGELWKISAKGPHGSGYAYANSKREAEDEARVIRSRGWRVTHIIRLEAPGPAPVKKRMRRNPVSRGRLTSYVDDTGWRDGKNNFAWTVLEDGIRAARGFAGSRARAKTAITRAKKWLRDHPER